MPGLDLRMRRMNLNLYILCMFEDPHYNRSKALFTQQNFYTKVDLCEGKKCFIFFLFHIFTQGPMFYNNNNNNNNSNYKKNNKERIAFT